MTTSIQAHSFDVAVVGASIAGCANAIYFARRGLKVALIDRHSEPNFYKKLCTHYIQASAVPVMKELDIYDTLVEMGADKTAMDTWTPWGWIQPKLENVNYPFEPYGFNVKRNKFDPVIRDVARKEKNIELLLGHSFSELQKENGQVVGLTAIGPSKETVKIQAKLVVGADGRSSKVSDQAKIKRVSKPNNRSGYSAYFKGVKLTSGTRSQTWMMNPDIAYAFHCDDDLVELACFIDKQKLDTWGSDKEACFKAYFATLPDCCPDLSEAELVSPLYGVNKLDNTSGDVIANGVALVGDSALAPDPIFGTGIGWALQAAKWLVEETADTLLNPTPNASQINMALARYQSKFEQQLFDHEKLISDFSRVRPYKLIEKLMFRAAAHDDSMARHSRSYTSRHILPREFITPAILLKLLWINLKVSLRKKLRSTDKEFDVVTSS